MRGNAFSLIELVVVLLILTIAATAVAMRVGAPLGRVRGKDAEASLAAFDRLTRAWAEQQDQDMAMTFDLPGGEVRRRDGQARPAGVPLRLPKGWRMTRLRFDDGRTSEGIATVPVSRHGLTPSYATALAGPNVPTAWLVFAGMTGQVAKVDDEGTAEEILGLPGPSREGPDAR